MQTTSRETDDRGSAAPTGAEAPKFYYGWVNVFIAAMAMSATIPGRTYGLGLIKEPARAELGLSDLRFNVINFWAIIIGAVVVIPVGRLIDRIGSRLMLFMVAAILGGCVLLMARAQDERQFAVALTLVRGFGQGALSVVAIALVSKWFRRRIGMAMGVFTVLLGFGFVAPIPIVDGLIKQHDWRYAWNGIGYFLLCFLAPIGLLFAKSSPEAAGVVPDDPGPEEAHAEPMTVLQALATPSFWIYTAAATIFNLAFSALTLDNELLMIEHGLIHRDVAKATVDAAGQQDANKLILGILMLSGLPANIIAGYLARKWPLGKILAVGVLILSASLITFPFVQTMAGAALYASMLGASGGVITVIYFAVYGHSYGRTHIGSIQSVVQVLSVFASAIGPVILAKVRDENGGNTAPFFIGFAIVSLLLVAPAWMVRPPTSALKPTENS